MSKATFNAETAVGRPPRPYEYVGLNPAEALRRTIAIINYAAESGRDRFSLSHLAELAPCLTMIKA